MTKHFDVGQIIWLDKQRYQIMAYGALDKVSLLPLDSTGPVRVERPFYLANCPR